MELSETLKDWLGTFWQILTTPIPKTFVEESEKAKDKLGSAIGWVIFIIVYSYLIIGISGYIFDITSIVIGSLVLPLVIILIPSAAHFTLQRIFHRKQYLYEKLLYIYTAIIIIFQLISIPVTLIVPADKAPIFNYLLITYQIVLFVIATKSIAGIKYWQAIVTVIVSLVIGTLVFICALPFITSLMGGVSGALR